MIRGYHLNSDSTNFIKKLVQRFEALGYNTEISSNPNGSIFFTASKLGGVNNRFDFYAKPNGNIDSIAIYGSHLKGHLDNVLEKQTIFGLPIEDAEIDRGGIENFIDIQIKSDYQISYHIALIKTNYGNHPSERDICKKIAKYDNAVCQISDNYLKLSIEKTILETSLTVFEEDFLTTTWLGRYKNGMPFRVVRPSNLYHKYNLGDDYITIASTFHDGYAVHFLIQ